ncbi:unnamed protein product [Spirodela intermedia]|uniref:Uncharacterized protein n=1 Tax=Spirodela intermedia TaxID=51605 RepID=A0A7I8J4T6_SPIIN|nr:unnamed protein product [Spirodela intermedia]CAA6664391.1 unnamed protein product [Spirodela intermedia]
MEMAAMWLPLLCRASPAAVGGGERAGVVAALEGIIAGLSWGQQEEMLSLWLHHFASSPHSDWPDLQPCYASWYAASRKLLLLHEETLQKGSTTPEGIRLLPADASST